ncbi:hypothetical protein DPMN_182391 [Dreissena polymorpha]|uniref:Uncharacterized protein n=1 Tax=Dreissena polymorpha TaxID=45954 RepID=A0A9D4I4J5_DREPO|nr:hypothetical protein DPMN_182391 [Dreissena polymorpha]
MYTNLEKNTEVKADDSWKEMAKERAPNFTLQGNTLLAHLSDLRSEDYLNFGMSRHKLDRHRFTSRKGRHEIPKSTQIFPNLPIIRKLHIVSSTNEA